MYTLPNINIKIIEQIAEYIKEHNLVLLQYGLSVKEFVKNNSIMVTFNDIDKSLVDYQNVVNLYIFNYNNVLYISFDADYHVYKILNQKLKTNAKI